MLSGWEQVFVVLLAIAALFFFTPGIKRIIEHSKDAEKDWLGLLLPIAAVVGFVLLLIALV